MKSEQLGTPRGCAPKSVPFTRCRWRASQRLPVSQPGRLSDILVMPVMKSILTSPASTFDSSGVTGSDVRKNPAGQPPAGVGRDVLRCVADGEDRLDRRRVGAVPRNSFTRVRSSVVSGKLSTFVTHHVRDGCVGASRLARSGHVMNNQLKSLILAQRERWRHG